MVSPTLGVETAERPRQSVRRFPDRAERSCRCARRRGARVREVIVDLPPHAIDLLLNGGSNLRLAGSPRPLRFVRNDGKRRLQAVRQVARLCHRAADGLLPLVEQRVEIVDERLHFCRVIALDAPLAALVQFDKARAKVADRRHAGANLQEPSGHAEHAQQQDKRLPEYVVHGGGYGHRGMEFHGRDQEGAHHDYEADGPEHGTEEEAASQRKRSLHFVTGNAIAEAADRFDDRRPKLAPQPRDEDFDRVRVAVEILRVDVLGQLAL